MLRYDYHGVKFLSSIKELPSCTEVRKEIPRQPPLRCRSENKIQKYFCLNILMSKIVIVIERFTTSIYFTKDEQSNNLNILIFTFFQDLFNYVESQICR